MKFHLVIPVHNESEIILNSVKVIKNSLSKSLEKSFQWKIILAENGSADNTLQIINGLKKDDRDERLEVLNLPNAGKGYAIKESAKNFLLNSGDIFGFIDADLSSHPDNISLLLEKMRQGGADIVVASRFYGINTIYEKRLRKFCSKIFAFTFRTIFSIPVKDIQCGLKIMNSKAVKTLLECKENSWFLDTEFMAKAPRIGLKIAEVPIEWKEKVYKNRKSKLNLFKDGSRSLSALWRIWWRLHF
ncbi:MAG: glycosyltransferase family 2 protein [Candidatus Taylorbacteria bacterium]|nr:glycosyltransferase family 2 protein [Candidatus Taylorbacteria bacterium]